MLNFVICEDNFIISEKLKKMLESIFIKNNYDASVAFKSDNAEDTLKYITSHSVDVLMLDINLNSKTNGLDLAQKIRKINNKAYIIFTTGHLEYAMVAYQYKTFDYLPKPISYDRLELTIKRLFEDINSMSKTYIKLDNKNTIIDENEIQYIEKNGTKLIFHTPNCNYETYSSFSKFQEKLPSSYIRCHKSYIANLNQIKNINSTSRLITFKDGHTCDIGPKYKRELMEGLQSHGIFL